jgi:signal transduction histidine kinase
MQRKILFAIMTVTTFVVLLFALPLGLVIDRLLNERAVLALEHRADLAARSIDITSPDDTPDSSEFPSGPEQFALYSPDGALRAGSGPAQLESELRTAASGSTTTQKSGSQLLTILPIVSGEKSLGYLRVARSRRDITRNTTRALALLVVGVLAVLTIGWVLARRLANGISAATTELRDAAIRLGSGDFTIEAVPVGIAELDDIGSALSSTAGDLEELVAREQSFSADVSHQLRTPVAGMRTSIEAELAFPRPDRAEILNESLHDLGRLEQTITDLLTLARTRRGSNNLIDPFAISTEARDRWQVAFVREGRTLTLRSDPSRKAAYGHTALLRQAIDALLDNSLVHGSGQTLIEIFRDTNSTGCSVTIAICDEGQGFTAKESSQPKDATVGGLGLPLTKRLIHAQGGRFVIARASPKPIFHIVLMAPQDLETDVRNDGANDF